MGIDKFNNLRCDFCGKKLGARLDGRVEIVCPRCHTFNVFATGVIPIMPLSFYDRVKVAERNT